MHRCMNAPFRRKMWNFRFGMPAFFALFALLACSGQAEAKTIYYTSTTIGFSGLQAVIDTQADPGDTIVLMNFDTSYTGLPYIVNITKDLTIEGNDQATCGFIIGTGPAIQVSAGARVTVKNLTFLGMGIQAIASQVTVSDCVFDAYTFPELYFTDTYGMSVEFFSTADVSRCRFINYRAQRGGGMSILGNSSATVSDCVFDTNRASEGGGVYVKGAATLARCRFLANRASGGGGVFVDFFGDARIYNCDFIGNFASDGGGLSIAGNATVANCTFTGNSAYGGGAFDVLSSYTPSVTNCILWGNSPDEVWVDLSSVVLSYCNIQGGLPPGVIDDGNNSDLDPMFAQTPDPGPDGQWGTLWIYDIFGNPSSRYNDDNYGDLHLMPASPCINVGNSAALPADQLTDLLGNPRFVGVVDLGAYESAPVNQPPVANAGEDQTVTVPHDKNPATNTATFTLDGTLSSDPDGDTLQYYWDEGPDIGSGSTLMLSRPPGTYTFNLSVVDPSGAFTKDTVVVTVLPEPNAPPTANGQSVSTDMDTAVGITLSGSDPDGDGLTYTLAASPQNGTLSGPALTYTPNPGYTGPDSFKFAVIDPYGAANTATINIMVNAVNQAPEAEDDSAVTPKNKSVNIAALDNDDDADGDSLAITGLTQPANGTAALQSNGTITYTPKTNFVGTDSFTYTVSDGKGGADTAAVTIEVEGKNRPPRARNNCVLTKRNTAVIVAVLSNDSDPDGDRLTVTGITKSPKRGAAVLNANGTITYTPKAGFRGFDHFRYRITDGKGKYDSAWVRILVW